MHIKAFALKNYTTISKQDILRVSFYTLYVLLKNKIFTNSMKNIRNKKLEPLSFRLIERYEWTASNFLNDSIESYLRRQYFKQMSAPEYSINGLRLSPFFILFKTEFPIYFVSTSIIVSNCSWVIAQRSIASCWRVIGLLIVIYGF